GVQQPGRVAQQAAEVVQGTPAAGVTVARAATARAGPAAIIARALAEEGRREVLDARDSLGAIRDILSRSDSHGGLLGQPGTAMPEESGDEEKSTRNPLSLLQSREIVETTVRGPHEKAVVIAATEVGPRPKVRPEPGVREELVARGGQLVHFRPAVGRSFQEAHRLHRFENAVVVEVGQTRIPAPAAPRQAQLLTGIVIGGNALLHPLHLPGAQPEEMTLEKGVGAGDIADGQGEPAGPVDVA